MKLPPGLRLSLVAARTKDEREDSPNLVDAQFRREEDGAAWLIATNGKIALMIQPDDVTGDDVTGSVPRTSARSSRPARLTSSSSCRNYPNRRSSRTGPRLSTPTCTAPSSLTSSSATMR